MNYEGRKINGILPSVLGLISKDNGKLILQILEFHRQKFPFDEGEDSANRDRYYWLSGFLNAFLEQQ